MTGPRRPEFLRGLQKGPRLYLALGLLALAGLVVVRSAPTRAEEGGGRAAILLGEPVPDPTHVGGEATSVVQVANLIYARVKTSRCFSEHFLRRAETDTTISTSRRYHAVKLDSEDVFEFPFVIMTGEGDFALSAREREHFRGYLKAGGFLLASAGCSSENWDRAFRRELGLIFPDLPLTQLSFEHPVFHTVFDIDDIKTQTGTFKPLEGLTLDGRLALIYSADGLNDTGHVEGCCCCGENEILNSDAFNLNILAYALLF